MQQANDLLTIGEISLRSGVATSALRFYESEGLLSPDRSPSGHRRYPRHALRRVAFIRAAQNVGLSLEEITEALTLVPIDQAPTKAQWATLSRAWRTTLTERITALEELRDDLTGCIGCGCLSLRRCRLSNPDDVAAALGTGARYLEGDDPDDAIV